MQVNAKLEEKDKALQNVSRTNIIITLDERNDVRHCCTILKREINFSRLFYHSVVFTRIKYFHDILPFRAIPIPHSKIFILSL